MRIVNDPAVWVVVIGVMGCSTVLAAAVCFLISI